MRGEGTKLVNELDLTAAPSKVNWPSVIRNYRMSKRLKQAALAADLGVTQAMISRWENGESDPPERVTRRLTDMVHDAFVVAPAPTWMDLISLNPAIEFVTDSMGMIKAVSRGASDLFGMVPERLEGRPVNQLIAGDFAETLDTIREKGMFQNSLVFAQSLGVIDINLASGLKSERVDFIHWPRISQARSTLCVHSGKILTDDEYTARLGERGKKLVMRRTL
jgi:transcriptional regulator with XRE-family HTH domain